MIIAANWKMNKTNAEVKAFFAEYETLAHKHTHKVIICAPATVLVTLSRECKKFKIKAGAQNLYPAVKGAYTGEISAEMIKETGAQYVLVGHSERRTLFRETDEFINQKLRAALSGGLDVILCVGETLDERNKGRTLAVIKSQLTKNLERVTENLEKITIAYEPVWAIGTGLTATAAQIEEVHAAIKEILAGMNMGHVAVLYGGSANETNCEEIYAIPNVDGVLVGGASLIPAKFAAMIK
jgi:triosephosphate isomerase